jgi:hypothetical protein
MAGYDPAQEYWAEPRRGLRAAFGRFIRVARLPGVVDPEEKGYLPLVWSEVSAFVKYMERAGSKKIRVPCTASALKYPSVVFHTDARVMARTATGICAFRPLGRPP